MVVLLDGSVVNLALPEIAADLHIGFSGLQWIVDGYLLSLSALILLGGSLGDIFGRKKIYLIGLGGFGLSSFLCALAPNAGTLIGFRAIQGIFGALLVPGALAIINTNFPRELRGQAIGRWTAFISVAIIVGPLIGGLILGLANWRWIFLINLPLVIACYALGHIAIQESKDPAKRHLDYFGASLAGLALAAITYGLIEGSANGWDLVTFSSLVAGLILIPVFVWFERHHPDPMVDTKLFRNKNFSGANVMTFAMYGALGGFIFSLVIYLQTVMEYSVVAAGFSTVPISIIMFGFSGRIGKWAAKQGPRLFLTIGPIISGLGMFTLYALEPGDSYITHILPGILLFGIGLVITVAPLTTTVIMSVSEVHSGIASGINNAVSRAGSLIVVAMLGLFGAYQQFHFAMILCPILAILAGLLSYALIQKKPLTTQT